MKILITKRAKRNFKSIKYNIEQEWGVGVAKVFEKKTKNFLELLENYPKIGTIEVEEKEIRGFPLTKQTSIFYRIKRNAIIILMFFDTRQNPIKKPK